MSRREDRPWPRSYREILGQKVRKIRLDRRWRQDDVARLARQRGLPWNQATVAAIETGRRSLSLGEALLLQMILRVPLSDLLRPTDARGADDSEMILIDEVPLSRGDYLALISGDIVYDEWRWRELPEQEELFAT